MLSENKNVVAEKYKESQEKKLHMSPNQLNVSTRNLRISNFI